VKPDGQATASVAHVLDLLRPELRLPRPAKSCNRALVSLTAPNQLRLVLGATAAGASERCEGVDRSLHSSRLANGVFAIVMLTSSARRQAAAPVAHVLDLLGPELRLPRAAAGGGNGVRRGCN